MNNNKQNKINLYKNILLIYLCSISIFAVNIGYASTIPIHQLIKETQITINISNKPLRHILEEISKKSNIAVVFRDNGEIDKIQNKSLNVENSTIDNLLNKVLNSTPFTYSVYNNVINIIQRTTTIETHQNEKSITNIKVVDKSTNKPIIGALVVVKGTNKGQICDAMGTAELYDIKLNTVLEISCLGYITQTYVISDKLRNIIISMKEDVLDIEDVVITGYQTISKERATGSYTIINKDQIDKPSSSIAERLIGTTAGVVASTNKDGNLEFEIRGKTSLNANAQPLIVVDGFAVEDGFSSINPNDVESMVVLKDASAASIWGARSANGVIVITTKKAKAGKVNINLSSFYKFSNKLDVDYVRNLANTSDLIDYELNAHSSDFFGGPWAPVTDGIANLRKGYSEAVLAANEYKLNYLTRDQFVNTISILKGRDNSQQIRDNILVRPATQQYNLTISGGTEKMSNSLSLLFSNSNNNFKFNNNNEYLINYKTQVKVAKWLEFNFGGMFQYRDTKDGGLSSGTVAGLSPYEDIVNHDGSYTDVTNSYYMPMVDRLIPRDRFSYSDWTYNPIHEAENSKYNTRDINSRIQAGLIATITKGLTFNSSIQYEMFNKNINNVFNEETFKVRNDINMSSSWDQSYDGEIKANLPKGGYRDRSSTSINAYNFRNQINFVRTFAGKHSINMVAGSEIMDRTAQGETNPRTYGYDDDRLSVGTFPNGVKYKDMWGGNVNASYINKYSYSTDRYFSAYGNLSYTYDEKYTFSGSLRTDASNIISDDPQYRYSPFWSIGGGWNLHNEKFLSNVEFVDRLSFRATYGYNGNVDKTTAFMPLISMSSSQNIYTHDYTASISSYGNPSLRWEKTGTFNLGIDFSIFDGKLNGTLDYYDKKGKDLIVSMTIPSVNGTTSQKLNSGSMSNRGLEIRLGSHIPILKRDIIWNGEVTFAYNKNSITELYKGYYSAHDLYSEGTSAYREGYDANTIWSFNYAGTNNFGTEVNPNYKPVIEGAEGDVYGFDGWTPGDGRSHMFNQGTSVAPVSASFSSSFKIYDFDFDFILTGKFGHNFRRTGFNYPSMSGGKGLPNKYLSEVQNGSASDFVQIPESNEKYYFWDRFYPYLSYLTENAAHIRIQEISLGYSLPRIITNKLGLTSLKFYAQVNNVATILFNSYGEDPEYLYGSIKPLATYTFGFKLNF